MRKIKVYIIIALTILATAFKGSAATVVKAHLDSAVLLMGKIGNIDLVVEEPKDARGEFELFRTLPERGYIGVCGDSVEYRMPTVIDTIDAGLNHKILFKLPVQSFDSGAYMLPPFVYISGRDTIRSNELALKIVPVLANAEDPINDYAGTADPENPSIFDWVPDWVLDYWWLILIILLAIGVFLYAMRRYKKEGHLLPKKPEPTPYEKAIASLRHLKTQKLWEQGMEKEYYTELTEILRIYLYGRFGINAMEMTSRQIMSALEKNAETKDKRPYFRKILNMADFVKFAKVRPLPEDNVASYDNALRFIEETKPIPIAEEAGDKNPAKKGEAI